MPGANEETLFPSVVFHVFKCGGTGGIVSTVKRFMNLLGNIFHRAFNILSLIVSITVT
jgi:hypothetical protein